MMFCREINIKDKVVLWRWWAEEKSHPKAFTKPQIKNPLPFPKCTFKMSLGQLSLGVGKTAKPQIPDSLSVDIWLNSGQENESGNNMYNFHVSLS